jgi:WhiB family redox-sensing transcriptional regulator
MTAEKTCRVCGETKPIDEFHPHNSTRDGTRSSCRTCHNAERRGYDPPTRGVKARAKLATFDVANETWMDRAACRTKATDPDEVRANVNRFFPSKSAPPQRAAQIAAAKQVCADCPVKTECLAYAEKTHVQFGIFGGLTETDRRKHRRRRRQDQRGEAA